MPDRHPSRLSGYPHWETHNPDEATLVLSQAQRKFRQEVVTGQGYLMSSNTAALEWLMFSSFWTTAPQKAWTEADDRFYLLFFWNEGWNDYRAFGRHGRVGPEQGLLLSPHHSLYWGSTEPRDVVGCRIPSSVLDAEVEALAGRPTPPLEPQGVLQRHGPIWRLLDRFLRQLESGLFRQPSPVRRERQRRLITAVALGTPHNIQFRGERFHNVPPLHKLRYERAMAFLEANLTVDISLGDVAKAAGVSERGLERDFGYYEKAPLQELHSMRMRAARRDLLTPDETTTVTSVALKYVLDPRRFAADYAALFGEYPHITLQLGRLGRRVY